MKRLSILALCLGVFAVQAASARADIPFSFTAVSATPAIPDEDIAVFPLTMSPAYSDILPAPPYPMPVITSLELVLTGLNHTEAGDLDIYLIDPFGKTLKIMTDLGVGTPIQANLIFNDSAAAIPPAIGPILTGTYLPEDTNPLPGDGFSKFLNGPGGTDAWILVIIDDSPGNVGSLDSFTLRGTAVPEPVTLSLLALGALTLLRRRRA
jgi:hypothetical protein